MAVERVIGVDFGTSTSIVKTKRFEVHEVNGSKVFNPVGDKYHTNSVTFSSDPRALSFVRINEDGTFDCGIDEEIPGSKLYREFKMNLESDAAEESEKSKELTHEYMKYLFDRYSHQSEEGVHGEKDDEISTIISFPVKWKDETRKFMVRAAKEAGFKNVTAMDEASAALYAVLCRNMDNFKDKNLLNKNKENTILIVDMGAGTTDLAVCRCTVDADGSKVKAENIKNELVFSWPDSSVDITFGGREIDEKLKEFLIDYLVKCNLPQEAGRSYLEQNRSVKTWKEETLSPSLRKGVSVKNCSIVDGLMFFPGIKKEPFPEITRTSFEKTIEDKIEDFKTLVNGCLDKLDENCTVDIVILTGGHSNWYFAKELMDGTMPGIVHPALKKVQAEKIRVMNLENPQETVALGMVYSKLPFDVIGKTVVAVNDEDRSNTYSQNYTADNYQELYNILNVAAHNKRSTNDILASVFSSYSVPTSLDNLKKTLEIEAEKTVFYANDISPEQDGSEGTIICEDGIYATSKAGDCVIRTRWVMFCKGTLVKQEDAIICRNGKMKTILHGQPDQLLFDMLMKLQEKLKKETVASSVPKADGVNAGNLMNVLTSVLSSYPLPPSAETLRKTLKISDNKTIFFARDISPEQNGSAGTVICEDGIFSTSNNDCYVVKTSWKTFATGNLLKQDYSITCNNGYLSNRVHGTPDQEVFGIFVNLQKKLIEEKVVAVDKKRNSATGNDGQSNKIVKNEAVAAKVKAYVEANKGLVNGVQNGNVAGLRRHLGVLEGERLYSWKDTTFFGSGKNGWAFTERAFYCRPLWEPPIRMDWVTFQNCVSITYSEEYEKIQLLFKGGREYPIYCFGKFKEFQKFFVGLYKTFSDG